ncbi:hypothetical protein [Bradyrhizobium sp.]|uniref:hypothetical protein n=1 Tax=Bradyrhizobium sp. TaxID=376 RepID=UPI0025C61619|nr:hypothetical protein [Bradyrhizobium sp.]
MSEIPLHLQRRFEQRWAARFALQVPSATPKHDPETPHQKSVVPRKKAKEKPAP